MTDDDREWLGTASCAICLDGAQDSNVGACGSSLQGAILNQTDHGGSRQLCLWASCPSCRMIRMGATSGARECSTFFVMGTRELTPLPSYPAVGCPRLWARVPPYLFRTAIGAQALLSQLPGKILAAGSNGGMGGGTCCRSYP